MAWRKRGLAMCVVIAAMFGTTVMGPGTAKGQGALSKPPMSTDVTTPETDIIPRLTISERYDSNVFFIQGGNFEDYVTTVSPHLTVAHRSPLFEATVGGGATSETYVNNPGLNYVAGSGSLDLNLNGLMNQLVSGLGLNITEHFRYTPQPSAFAAPEGGSQVSDSFVRGIQARRANSFTNSATVAGSYKISPLVSFNSTYSDARIRFGSTATVPGTTTSTATFINTTFQSVTTGPAVQISPLDTVSLSHQYQKGSFNFPGAPESGFSTQGAIAGWTRMFTPTLTGEFTGGIVVFDKSNKLQYLGSASLAWTYRDLDASLSYSRVIAPSFFAAGTPLLSQRVSGTVTHHITEPLSVSIIANYAINESTPDSSLLKFESYSVSPSGSYRINRVITAKLSYTRSKFIQAFSGLGGSFDRDVVLLRFVAEWK